MKTNTRIIILIVFTTSLFQYCCGSKYYVDDHSEDTIYSFPTKLTQDTIQHRIDRLKKSYTKYEVLKKDTQLCNESAGLFKPQRFIYFNEEPKEIYMIHYSFFQIEIVRTYSPQLNKDEFIDKKTLSRIEIERIKNRFKAEILNKLDSINNYYK